MKHLWQNLILILPVACSFQLGNAHSRLDVSRGWPLIAKGNITLLKDILDKESHRKNMCLEDKEGKRKLVSELYILGVKNSATSSLYLDMKNHGILNNPDGGQTKEWPYLLWGRNATKDEWLKRHLACPEKRTHMADWAVTNIYTIPMPADLRHSQDFGFPKKEPQIFMQTPLCMDWDTPKTLKQWYGPFSARLKFVIMLREPLARMQSEWYHTHPLKNCPGCMAKDNFRDALEFNTELALRQPPEITDWMWKSMYARHFEGWFPHFAAKQFTVIPYKFYVKDDTVGISKLFIDEFHLRAQPWNVPAHVNEHEKPSLEKELTTGDHARLLYEKFIEPENERLCQVFEDFGRRGGHFYGYEDSEFNQRKIKEWLENHW